MSISTTTPIVSIVIPVYNGAKYIEECLESIYKQTFTNWECCINNNYSTDGTLDIVERFVKKDARFKVFNNDEFVSLVDNWCLAATRIVPDSKYVKIIGADDWLFPEYLAKMVEVMELNPNIGVCSSYRLNSTKVDMSGLDIYDGNVFNGKDILYKQLTRQLDISGSITLPLFSHKYLKQLPYYPNIFFKDSFHIDTELFYDILNISDIGFVYQVLSYTRRHAESGTSTEALRFNTFLQLNERVLFKFKGTDPYLNKLFVAERKKYAYHMLKAKIRGWKKTIKWHKQYIVRSFTFKEYLAGLISYNPISNIISRIVKKIFT